MKITGSGPLIAIPTFIYLLATIIIHLYTKPVFTITENHYQVLAAAALIMIITGIFGVASSAKKLVSAFNAGVLAKDGLYRVCRNPLYAVYVFLVVPGICLLFNSWLVLTSVLIIFTLTLVFVRKEYKYLEEKFGNEYKEYVERVWIKFI